MIFIDDASTDDSLDVVAGIADKHGILKILKNPVNRGVNANLTRALEMATGDYVVGTACDDQVLPGFFEKSMSLLARHPQAGLCSSVSRVMDEEGNDLGLLNTMVVSDAPTFLPPEATRRLLGSFGNWMQGNTTIYRREALIEAGGFRPELRSFSDNFASQVLALKHGACFIPEPLCSWRRMPTTYSVRCLADSEIGRRIIENACSLMQGEYRDLFPRGYARNWEREAAFEHARALLQVKSAAANPEEPAAASAPAARRTPAWSHRLRAGLAMLYLIARYRPMISIRRKLKMTVTGGPTRRLAPFQP